MGKSADSNPVAEDAVVSSIDVGPDQEGHEYLNRTTQEHYDLKQAVNLWQGPKYTDYCSLIDRVRSFQDSNWPDLNPTPISLAEAGFFFNGTLTTFVIVPFC